MGQGGERRRGTAAGQRGPSRGSRGPASPLSTRPLPPPPFCLPLGVAAAALRRRFPGCGHFPASLARGPRTGGFCPPGSRQRAPPAASRPPPSALRPPPAARSPAWRPASPRAAPARAAQVTRPGAARGPSSRSPKPRTDLTVVTCQWSSFSGDYRIKMRISRSLIRRSKQQ